MNRSILIVICDFLLVSLLAFSTVDIKNIADDAPPPAVSLEIKTNAPNSRQDLAAVMSQALKDERADRERLLGELASTRDSLTQQKALLEQRDQQLQNAQQQARAREQEAQRREQEARRLQQETDRLKQQTARLEDERTTLAKERLSLQQQFAMAQTNAQTLRRQLDASATDMLLSKEKLDLLAAEFRRQQEQAAALLGKIGQLEKTNQAVLNEKQALATKLAVAEAEQRAAFREAALMQDQVKVAQQEKARLLDHAEKLTAGVKSLATNTSQLAQEIREHRPETATAIFSGLATNRVRASFFAARSAFLGIDGTRQRATDVVLAHDGTNTYAVCHIDETPLVFWQPGIQWEELTGSLSGKAAFFPIGSLAFYLLDPRVVLLPVTPEQVKGLGVRAYRLSTDPFQFEDAVVVGAKEGYYGECRFQVDLSAPQYLKMDRNFLKGLFGKFNPSTGDLVFSRRGELLGVMANNTYCVRLLNFKAVAAVRFGPDTREQRIGDTLSQLFAVVNGLPQKVR